MKLHPALKRWESVLALLLIAEILLFGAINPVFLQPSMLLYATSDFIHVGITALALTLVIITGGIDLSLGSVMGLSAITLGILWVGGVDIWVAAVAALGVGTLGGVFNAVAIHLSKVNPLVITLGTGFLFGGAALVLSGLAGATGYEGISNFDPAFVNLANLEVLGLPLPFALFLALTVGFMALCSWIAVRRGWAVTGDPFRWSRVLSELRRSLVVLLMPVIVIGGIVGGAFTPPKGPPLLWSMRW